MFGTLKSAFHHQHETPKIVVATPTSIARSNTPSEPKYKEGTYVGAIVNGKIVRGTVNCIVPASSPYQSHRYAISRSAEQIIFNAAYKSHGFSSSQLIEEEKLFLTTPNALSDLDDVVSRTIV